MKIKIQTTLGDIIVRLYDETPVHRDNFLKLAKEGFYDGTLFHRVIKDFMIQGGDPDSKGAPAGKMLGVGDPGYTLEAEIKDGLFHKRGALAAARQGDGNLCVKERRNPLDVSGFCFCLCGACETRTRHLLTASQTL